MIKCYIYVKTAIIDIPKDCNQRNDILGSKDWHELYHFRRKEKNWLGPNWEAVAPFLVASPGKKGAWKKNSPHRLIYEIYTYNK